MWVSPAEIEDAVARHPAVLEAAVIAEADDTGGTIPAAYVMVRSGNTPDEKLRAEIAATAAQSLPRFKQPKRIQDRKSTRLNSSHLVISYAVFCLKKKKKNTTR